ncbi:MAG TPA: hypothetical protein VEA18_03440 [Candidatus Kapabacteria bacterium]|nr:hypothetical protein [Candidatus Kapabacteria bacterium]
MLISAKDIIVQSLALYKGHFMTFLKFNLLSLVPYLLYIPMGLVGAVVAAGFFSGNIAMSLLIGGGIVLFLLFIAVIYLGIWFNLAFLRAVASVVDSGTSHPVGQTVKESQPLILRSLWTSVVAGFYTAWPLLVALIGWPVMSLLAKTVHFPPVAVQIINVLFVLLGLYGIFHAIVYSVKLMFAYYNTAIDNHRTKDALQKSKDMVKNRWWGMLWRSLAPAFAFGVPLVIVIMILGVTDNAVTSILSMVIQFLAMPLFFINILLLFMSAKKTLEPATMAPPTQNASM